MKTQEAYNEWANSYDSVINKTRDIEAFALKNVLSELEFATALEIGCGTGKNTLAIAKKAVHVTAVDFSQEMLQKAKMKMRLDNVTFKQADITKPWNFTNGRADLITFSLILEHIKDLDFVFDQCSQTLSNRGYVYIGELHPFKQYSGSKANFETANGKVEVEAYVHHISDYLNAAANHSLKLTKLEEWFDDDNTANVPRLVSFLFQKN